jgi:hypothetical protein
MFSPTEGNILKPHGGHVAVSRDSPAIAAMVLGRAASDAEQRT